MQARSLLVHMSCCREALDRDWQTGVYYAITIPSHHDPRGIETRHGSNIISASDCLHWPNSGSICNSLAERQILACSLCISKEHSFVVVKFSEYLYNLRISSSPSMGLQTPFAPMWSFFGPRLNCSSIATNGDAIGVPLAEWHVRKNHKTVVGVLA